MDRRLPVYILLDVSASMNGEPIESLNLGLRELANALRLDPQAGEIGYISVITFSQHVRQIVPLTQAFKFQPPTLSTESCTNMGLAMAFTAERIEAEVVKGNAEQKGDWTPLVFIMTDGAPTDDWKPGMRALHAAVPSFNITAFAAGSEYDIVFLKAITNDNPVYVLQQFSRESYADLFKMISRSIAVRSKAVQKGIDAPLFDEDDIPETIEKF